MDLVVKKISHVAFPHLNLQNFREEKVYIRNLFFLK